MKGYTFNIQGYTFELPKDLSLNLPEWNHILILYILSSHLVYHWNTEILSIPSFIFLAPYTTNFW